MARFFISSIEPLEARIAPASLAVFHPIADVIPSVGQTGTTIDLANSFDSNDLAGYRTHIVFTTNYDIDPVTPGLQPGKIVLELFDDKTPLTVANFINYVKGLGGDGSYLNTFFHRSSPGFVLQGGGYSDNPLGQHIATGVPVHNEYNASDPELSNTTGTVAMAKVGTQPNSATSEFFFNLADNNNPAGNDLDTLNGGFTVFAKVTSGMDVVNAIAALPTAQIGLTGGSDGTPYQNGFIPGTKLPTPNQLVDITGVQVIPAAHSSLPGVTYKLIGITDEITGQPTHIVTGKVTGNNLKLNYTPGATGVADVTVQALDHATGETVLETFHVQLTPNLVGTITSDTLGGATSSTLLQAGDSGAVTTKFTNTGLGTTTGFLTVNYYLSPDSGDPLDADGTHVDANDLFLGSFTTSQAVSIASGKSFSLTSNVQIPTNGAVNLTDGTYHLVAQISTSNNDQLHGDFYQDDNEITGADHTLLSGARAAHVSAASVTDTLPLLIVPGDVGKATLTVINQTQTEAIGTIHAQFYLVENSDPSSGAADSSVMTPIGGGDYQIDLALGKTANLSADISVPSSLAFDQSSYHVVAVITDGAAETPLVSSTNKVGAGNFHALENWFGTISVTDSGTGKTTVRKNVPLTYLDSDNQLVTVKMTGPGFGIASLDPDGGVVWSTQGTTGATNLTASLAPSAGDTLAPGAHTVVKDIFSGTQLGEAMGTLSLGLVDWSDAVAAQGGFTKLTLGNTSGAGDHSLTIGDSGARPSITLGNVQDTTLNTAVPLTLLSATAWLSVDGHAQSVNAPGIATLKITGDFAADLTVIPPAAKAAPVVKVLNIGGALQDANVRIEGNVGTVTIGSVESSDFLVGTVVVPQSASDFDAIYSVAKITVDSISQSSIAAAKLGTVVVRSVDPNNDVQPFGLIAEKIASYTHRPAATRTNLNYANTTNSQHEIDPDGDYLVTLLDPTV